MGLVHTARQMGTLTSETGAASLFAAWTVRVFGIVSRLGFLFLLTLLQHVFLKFAFIGRSRTGAAVLDIRGRHGAL